MTRGLSVNSVVYRVQCCNTCMRYALIIASIKVPRTPHSACVLPPHLGPDEVLAGYPTGYRSHGILPRIHAHNIHLRYDTLMTRL